MSVGSKVEVGVGSGVSVKVAVGRGVLVAVVVGVAVGSGAKAEQAVMEMAENIRINGAILDIVPSRWWTCKMQRAT